MSSPTNEPERDTDEEEKADPSSPVLFFASNGDVYMNADEMPVDDRAERKAVFVYLLTEREKEVVHRAVGDFAWNVPFELFAKRRQRERKAGKPRQRPLDKPRNK